MGGPRGTSRDSVILDAKARGIADAGKANRIAKIDAEAPDAELGRADYRDAYRAGMISPLTDESLASQEIEILLVRARQMVDGIKGGWGPRTQYANATNLLTLYVHLLDRARVSARDRDGALLTKSRAEKTIPWSPNRIKRVDDLPEFETNALAKWNEIVALGPPPAYDPRRPWSGKREPKIRLIEDRRPRPGWGRGAGYIDLPMGMYAVIRPGGADARLMYGLIKTEEMSMEGNEGRLAVLTAVISQILHNEHSVDFYKTAAQEMLRREPDSQRGAVYANDPAAFKKLYHSADFKFEVGISFLMHLDEVTGGAVPLKLMNLLEPGIDVKTKEARPLWQELYPNNTRAERVYWAWKRMTEARPLYDPANGRPMPGHFYEGNQMFYVADGMFAGDQIWMTQEARIYAVNEREALIEAFRQGVMAAAGMVAVAYMMVALSLVLVQGPAIIANLARFIRCPIAVSKELFALARAKPLTVLGNLAVDQGANMILSGGPEKYLENLGGADTWVSAFLSVLMIKDLRVIKLPSGAEIAAGPGGVKLLSAGSQAADSVVVPDMPLGTPLASGGKSGTLTPDAPTPVTTTPPAVTVIKPLKSPRPAANTQAGAADSGAAAVIRTDATPAKGDVTPARPPPDTAGDVPVKPPATAGDAPVKPPDAPGRRGTTEAERGSTVKQRDTDTNAQANKREVDEDVDVNVAEAAGGGSRRGSRPRGAAGQRRQRRPEPPGGKRGIDGRKRGTDDRRGEGGRGGGGGGRRPGGGGGGGGRNPGGGGGGNAGTGDEVIRFTRDGINYEARISPEARQAYDDIPVGDTVVYTVRNGKGEVIYVGISKKTDRRQAVDRLQEHLTTKEGDFVAGAEKFEIVGHYPSERAAHALEHSLVVNNPSTKTYNKDQTPWDTFVDYHGSRQARYERKSRGLDDDLRKGQGPTRRKPTQDWQGEVPKEMPPIKFEIKFDDGLPPVRGPRKEPGVDPDFDPPFNPKTDL
jgi:uncharacterized membrane protein YgcG